MNDVRDRYLRDPVFHAVVDSMRAIINSATLTPSEVREAAMLACVIEEQYRPRAPFSTSDQELEIMRQALERRPPTVAPVAICERCQMKLPERLVTFGPGVRGGTAARCAACNPQSGPDGEENRLEVIELRKARHGAPAEKGGA